MNSAIRADLHNTAGKRFDHTYQAADFMPGAKSSVEDRARALMSQGYEPAAAVAIASSSQSREHKLHLLKSAMSEAHEKKLKGKQRKRAG